MEKQVNPWHALWALCIGFFMILVDSTIVAVANPAIMEDLGTDINKVVWVTSAYLLAYAVPLLVTCGCASVSSSCPNSSPTSPSTVTRSPTDTMWPGT